MAGPARPPGAPAAAGEPAPLRGQALFLAGMVLAFANFMAVLDMSIANVSVPNIAGGLAVSPNEGTWVITSYSVAEAITVPLTGWLAQRFGTVKMFVFAMSSFGVCSALCGLAPSLGALVVFRILQGLSGGPMMPLSQTLLLRIFPRDRAPQAIGLWSMTTVVAPIAGPVLGGMISDTMGWPWVFYVNVPVAAICATAAFRFLASQETPILKRPVDFVGLGLLVLWVGAMQIMLDKGKELDWFASGFIVSLLIVAVVGFFAFLIWEVTAENPIVDLRVFRHRGFAVSCIVMALTFGAFFSSVVLVPLWLQVNMGYTATWAGYATAFNGMLAVVMSPIVPLLMRRFDPRALICFGVFWLAGVMLVRTTFSTDISFGQLILPQLAQGFAMPLFFIPLMAVGTGALPPAEIAAGAGLINFVRTTAGAFAVSLTTTAWDDSATRSHALLAGRLNDPGAVVAKMTQAGLSPDQALRQLDGLLQSQSVMLATNHVFAIIALTMALAAMSVWFAPRPLRPAGPAMAH